MALQSSFGVVSFFGCILAPTGGFLTAMGACRGFAVSRPRILTYGGRLEPRSCPPATCFAPPPLPDAHSRWWAWATGLCRGGTFSTPSSKMFVVQAAENGCRQHRVLKSLPRAQQKTKTYTKSQVSDSYWGLARQRELDFRRCLLEPCLQNLWPSRERTQRD